MQTNSGESLNVLVVGDTAQVPGVAGQWTRASDAAAASELLRSQVFHCVLLQGSDELVQSLLADFPQLPALRHTAGGWELLAVRAGRTTRLLSGLRPDGVWDSILQLAVFAHRQNSARRRARAGWKQARKGQLATSGALGDAVRLASLFDLAPVGFVKVCRQGRILQVNQFAAQMFGHPPGELLGSSLVGFVAPEQADQLLGRIWAYFRGEEIAPFEVRLRDRQGEVRHTRLFGQRIVHRSVFQLHLTLVDISAERQTRESMEAMQGLLRAVVDSLEVGLLTGDAEGRVETANPASGLLLGNEVAQMLGARMEELLRPAQELCQGRQVLWCRRANGQLFLANLTLTHVRVNRRWKTILEFTDVSENRRDQQEIDDIRERERRRIGLELHDDLGQTLTALAFSAGMLQSRLVSSDDAKLPSLATTVAVLSKQSIGKTRALARALYPANLERNGLTGALLELASDIRQIYGMETETDLTPVCLGRRESLHLFRIAQEAVTNAVKHSRAGRISIGLQTIGQMICLTVSDDGSGLPDHVIHEGGVGMRSMRHHAKLLEATLQIERGLDGGTQVGCICPESIHQTQS